MQPERNLLASIIGQAVDDIKGEKPHYRLSARQWLNETFGTFDLYCELLELAPDQTRAAILGKGRRVEV
jgi:hypothetical protein